MPQIASTFALKSVMFAQERIIHRLAMVIMPEFAQDQINRMQADPTATIQAVDQKQWCALAGWLEPPDRAAVQCRRSGLTVQLKRKQGLSRRPAAVRRQFPSRHAPVHHCSRRYAAGESYAGGRG